MHDFLHAEIAAALDDLLERRDQRFAAVEAEALGAGIFDVEEFLEAFGFDQLVEDGALAFAGEGDFLVAAFDALLDPAFLRGVGDVHELDADGLAIGAAQDGDDLAHRREFETEHLVEENLAVEIGFGEAVGARIELGLVRLRHRARADRAWRGNGRGCGRRGSASARGSNRASPAARRSRDSSTPLALRLGGNLVADFLFGLGPLAVERGDQIAVRTQRPVRLLPGGAARAFDDVRLVVLQALEKLLPLGVDRGRVGLVFGVEVFDVGGVAAVEEDVRAKAALASWRDMGEFDPCAA